MKLIARILAILAAALVVIGIAFAISQTSFAQSAMPSMPDHAALVQQPGTTQTSSTADVSSAPTQRGPEDEHGEQGMSLFGAIDLLQNVVVVGIIVAVVSLAKWLWSKIGGKRDKGKRKRVRGASPAM